MHHSTPHEYLCFTAALSLFALALSAHAGFGFSAPVAISPNASSDTVVDGGPRLETSGHGTWIASWPRGPENGENDVVISRSLDFGATWSKPLALNANPDNDTVSDINPRLATDGAGNWVAIWVRVNDPVGTLADNDLLVARSDDDGMTWSSPEVLSLKADLAAPFGFDVLTGTPSPALATDGVGAWIAAWRATVPAVEGGDIDIYTSTSLDNGDTWSSPVSITSSLDALNNAGPRIAPTGPGEWMIMWNTIGLIIADGLYIARSSNNGDTWSSPEPLITYAASDDTRHNISRLETDGSGVWIALGEFASHNLEETVPIPTSDYDIFVMRSEDNGETWSAPARLIKKRKKEKRDDLIPVLTTDRAGKWLAAWITQDSALKAASDADISASYSDDNGKTWTQAVWLNHNAMKDSGNDLIPAVKTDGSGNWLAVWTSNNRLPSQENDVDMDIHSATSVFTSGDQLVMLAPDGGERLWRGRKTGIQWLSFGDTGARVSLNLLRKNFPATPIAKDTKNDGVFRWQLPISIEPGRYKIEVRSVDHPNIKDRSDRPFRIRDARP